MKGVINMCSFNEKTNLDRQIETVKEMQKKWNRLMKLYLKSRDSGKIYNNDESESLEIFSWMQQNYINVSSELKGVVVKEYIDKIRGIRVKDYDEILNLIGEVGSLVEMSEYPLKRDLENNLRGGRNRLNMYLGYLETKKRKSGEIDLDEYKMLKKFYEGKIKEKERMKERENLVTKLNIKGKKYELAKEYFEESKSCFIYGFLKGSVILAISALETCIKTDYLEIKGEDYEGKFYNLLNRYFTGDIKRLPKQYDEFSKTYLKIRNSLTHPEEFDFSENIVHNVLSTVAVLINHVVRLHKDET